jgi:hypothetical protein
MLWSEVRHGAIPGQALLTLDVEAATPSFKQLRREYPRVGLIPNKLSEFILMRDLGCS